MTLTEAYARCQQMAAAHYENFPVASRLVPARMRPHVAAVYAFARTADDFADEGVASEAQRLAWLDEWRTLRQAGPAAVPAAGAVGSVPAGDVRATFTAVHDTIARCRLDAAAVRRPGLGLRPGRHDPPLRDVGRRARLLPAVGQPGRAAGARNRWRRATRHRATLRCRLHGAAADQLLAGPRRGLAHARSALRACGPAAGTRRQHRGLDAGATDEAWRRVIDVLGARTDALFDEGRAVCDAVRGRLRYELRATWLGGTTILRQDAGDTAAFTARPPGPAVH